MSQNDPRAAAEAAELDPSADVDAPTEQRRPTWRVLFSNPVTVISAIVLLVVVLVAVFGRWLMPYGVNSTDVLNNLQGPSGSHLFGTDDLGRDVFSRVIASTSASAASNSASDSDADAGSIVMTTENAPAVLASA